MATNPVYVKEEVLWQKNNVGVAEQSQRLIRTASAIVRIARRSLGITKTKNKYI